MPPRVGGHFTPKSTASRPASTTQQMVRYPRIMLMKWNASQMMKLTHKTLNPTFRPFSHRISSPNTSPSMQTQWLILKWRTQGSILRGKRRETGTGVKVFPRLLPFWLVQLWFGINRSTGMFVLQQGWGFLALSRVFCSALSITN